MSSEYQAFFSTMTIDDKVALLTGNGLWKTASLPHHGIDSIKMTDGTYGVRYSPDQIDNDGNWSIADFLGVVNQSADQQSDKKGSEALFGRTLPATCFPNGSSLACSWDVELAEKMGQALAHECQALGISMLLGPGINIRRTPLSGRGYEYYSEDPLLSGDLAAAVIDGLQKEGVAASLKHFACNNSEYRRTEMDSVVDERALHEIYLSGFKRAIDKANPWTVMSSYNRLNGEQTSQHHWLLTEVLREQWGYDGLVISDWYGVKDRPASLLAGNDLAMPEVQRDKQELKGAIINGRVPMSFVDNACERVMKFLLRVSNPVKRESIDVQTHHQLAQQIAQESVVLLKNEDHILPVCKSWAKSIAVIGDGAQRPVIQGSGCATTVPSMLDTPLDEIIELAGDQFDVSYARGTAEDGEFCEQEQQKAVEVARNADLVVLFMNTVVGEDGENGDRKDLSVIESHITLLEALNEVNSHIVVVLSNSDAVVMPWLNNCKGLLETFFAGQGFGRAVARLLFGEANPSGKLTTTLPNTLEETPAYLTYPGDGLRHHYAEGIYVGYRYYDKRNMQPLFPFGYGLSYTSFRYDSVSMDKRELESGGIINVSVTLTNTGKMAGKEIVQLYVTLPQHDLQHPPLALKGFAKILLQPGETGTVNIPLQANDLQAWHPALQQWILSAGEYVVHAGSHSRDLPLTETVTVKTQNFSQPLQEDSSLVQIIENKAAFEKIVTLVAEKSELDAAIIRERLTKIAPELFCGVFIALTEFLGVNVSRQELRAALIPNK